MLAVFDPVGIGVVKSLERSGTNVTGTTMYAPQLIGYRIHTSLRLRVVPNLIRRKSSNPRRITFGPGLP
jgi:putative ABC transport system substrate-binding protein